MAPVTSAGLLLYRRGEHGVEVLLGHMGGPFWARKDAGAWSVPKGELESGEAPLDAARREFAEELGVPPPDGESIALGEVRLSSGKVVEVWTVEGDLDPARVVPGTFTMEWPRGSSRLQEFPELDRVAWLRLDEARVALTASQRPYVERLVALLPTSPPGSG